MSEHVDDGQKETRQPSPADIDRWHKKTTGLGAIAYNKSEQAPKPNSLSIWSTESGEFAQPDQVFIKDGIWYRWQLKTHTVTVTGADGRKVDREEPLTYHGFYNHEPSGGMNGGGWDMRLGLSNKNFALSQHGRTFTVKQIFEPRENMPNEQMLEPVLLSNEELTELNLR